MRKRQKASQVLKPISLKITPAKEKERRKSEEEERSQEKRKKAMVELLVFILATLVVPFSKLRLDIFSKHYIGQSHKITTSKGERSLKLKTKKF